MKQLIECAPNFSEGRDPQVLSSIANAIQAIKGVKLLHQDTGYSAHRTVFTFAGEAEAVFEAAFAAIKVASEVIDMRKHQGEHPRIGACDVCPFVPISGITIEELVERCQTFGEKVNRELDIPVFFYESSATSPQRKNLARHRVGNYEALKKRMESGIWNADLGRRFNPKSGGTVIGVRPFLIAYNINLNTADPTIAQEIAYDLRELGRPIAKKNGKTIYKAGKLKQVKAIGWYIKEFKKAQVSVNLINFEETPLHLVFESCKEIARNYHAEVSGSELIGLIPLKAILAVGKYYSQSTEIKESELISLAVDKLRLNEFAPFEAEKRVLEYALKN